MNTAAASVVNPDDAHTLVPVVEALLFQSAQPVSPATIAVQLDCRPAKVRQALALLEEQLDSDDRGLKLVWNDTGAQLAIKEHYRAIIEDVIGGEGVQALPVVEQFLHYLRMRNCRPATLKCYGDFFRRFARSIGKPLDRITTADIRLFLLAEEARGNTPRSISTKIGYLRSWFKWALREEIVTKDPMLKIDAPKLGRDEPKYLTHEQVELAREACDNLLDRCLVEVLYGSGLRVSEAAALDWTDIDWQERTITVRDGKGGKTRMVPMSTRSSLLLQRMQRERVDGESYVFRSRHRHRMSKARIEQRVRQLGEKAGLPVRLTPHKFRHSLATHLLAADVPLDVVQVILGHAKVSTTQIYAKTQRTTVEHHYRRVVA